MLNDKFFTQIYGCNYIIMYRKSKHYDYAFVLVPHCHYN